MDEKGWDVLLAEHNQVGVLLQPPTRDAALFPFWLALVLCRGYDHDVEVAVAVKLRQC